jgi:hypothetical protein
MFIVKLLITKCIRDVRGYSTIQNVTAQKIAILKFIGVRTCDLDIVLNLLCLILFTNYMKLNPS